MRENKAKKQPGLDGSLCHCAIVPLCHGTGAPFDGHRRSNYP